MIFERLIELRAAGDGRSLSGIVVRYGDKADLGGFTEEFAPGSIKLADDRFGMVLNHQHDRGRPLARTGAGLDVFAWSDRVEFAARLPETTLAREARELIAAGLIRGVSIEFECRDNDWIESANGKGRPHRIVRDALMRGLALVDTPAYPASGLDAREAGYLARPAAGEGDKQLRGKPSVKVAGLAADWWL